MIHKSSAKPYQVGYIYLGRGYYLTVDPIGWAIGKFWQIFLSNKLNVRGTKKYPSNEPLRKWSAFCHKSRIIRRYKWLMILVEQRRFK